MKRINGSHYDVKVRPEQSQLIRLWLDTGDAANGTYAIMDGGTPDQPSPLYVREMQRYGILSNDPTAASQPLNVYASDRKYWESFWYRPVE